MQTIRPSETLISPRSPLLRGHGCRFGGQARRAPGTSSGIRSAASAVNPENRAGTPKSRTERNPIEPGGLRRPRPELFSRFRARRLTNGLHIYIYLNVRTPPEGIGKGGVAKADLSKIFKALGNRRRRAVFQAVWKAGSGERHGAGRARGVTVGEVARRAGLPQPTVSLYLQRLVEAGLVQTARAERTVLCTVVPAALEAIASFARNPAASG